MRCKKLQQSLTLILFIIVWAGSQQAHSETIHLINGDVLQAKVIALNDKQLSIQSDILGVLKVPREKVARIDFIQQPTPKHPVTQSPLHQSARSPNATKALLGTQNSGNANDLIQQVQQQMLTTAGPEANEMYQNLVQGVTSGSINIPQLKTMAEDTVQQIEELQAELGDDVGFALDGYLSILKGFIQKAEKNNKNVIK